MVQDMYNEEYFVQILLPEKQPATLDDSLFYKYYSELTDAQVKHFDTQNINQTYATQRGTILGVSLPNVASWLMQDERAK